IRASLLKRSESENLFFLSMHHIIGDGWSTQILVSEVVKTYNEYFNEDIAKDEILEKPLSIQYKDYTVWLEDELGGERYEKAESYWLEEFSG
ncbi:condensation domain-containing protein, partial [Paraburkholderia sp. SIMBA_030]|uniref:condensation domain-containing protein n=1 Tax=Paraburkholderia sp. SIMBA_030 TaxID=3085773 RepID=UPI003979EF0B